MRRLTPLTDVETMDGYQWATVRWLRRQVHERRLQHHKVGGRVLIDLDALDRLVNVGTRDPATSIPGTEEPSGLTLFPMDPSTTKNQWQWGARTDRLMQTAVSCVLWELHHGGPAEDDNGKAPSVIAERLRAKAAPYSALTHQRSMTDVFKHIAVRHPEMVERETVGKQTFRIALRVGPDELPPDPFRPLIEDKPRRGRPPKGRAAPPAASNGNGSGSGEPLGKPDEAPVETGPEPDEATLSPSDALAAVASFAAEALKLAGVIPDDTAPGDLDRVAEVMAENRRLQGLLDKQGTELLSKLRENEVLRRALKRHER